MGISSISGPNGDEYIVKKDGSVQEVTTEVEKVSTDQPSSTSQVTFSETNENELVEFECDEQTPEVAENTEDVSEKTAEDVSEKASEVSEKTAEDVSEKASEVSEKTAEETKKEKTKTAAKKQEEELKEALKDNEIDLLDFMNIISANDKLKEIASKIGYGTMFDKLDTDHNGVINGTELKNISGNKGNISDIKMSDLETFLINNTKDLLNATKTNSAQNINNTTTATSNVSTASDNSSVQNVPSTYSSSSANYSSGSSSTGGVSNLENTGDAKSIDEQIKEQEDNKASKTTELNNKTNELNAVYNGTDSDIKSKQDAVDKAKGEYDKVCDKSLNPFVKIFKASQDANDKNLEKDEKNINSANVEINNTSAEMTKQQSNIGIYENKISSIKSAITSLNSAKNAEGANTDKINDRISSLNSQKKEAETSKSKAQKAYDKAKEKNDAAKEKLTKAEKSKTEHEKTKQELIEKMNKFAGKEVKQKLKAYTKAQEALQTTKNNKIEKIKGEMSTIKGEITEIDNKIKELQTKKIEKQQKLSAFDDMDEDAANKLYQAAQSLYGNNRTSHGRCGTGVSDAFYKAFGVRLRGNGNQWDDVLSQRSDWVEITDEIKNVDDLSKLPAGAVVSWDKTGPSYESQTYGHVYISDGNGGEISDYHGTTLYANRRRLNYGSYRVFIPTNTVA